MSSSNNTFPVATPSTFSTSHAINNIMNADLKSFFEGDHETFKGSGVHQVKRGIETDVNTKDDGGTETVYFRLEVDEATGESIRIYVTTVDIPGDDDPNGPEKGLTFHVPKELLETNDPAVAEKYATAFANVIVETGLDLTKEGREYNLHFSGGDYKWKDLTVEKMEEAMLRHKEDFQAKGIVASIEGRVIVGPAQQDKAKIQANDEQTLVGRQQFFSLRAMKPNMDNSPIGKVLQRAEEMGLNPETYMRNQGINPELPENIRKMAELAENEGSQSALTILESLAENRENSSALAQSLLAGVNSTKQER